MGRPPSRVVLERTWLDLRPHRPLLALLAVAALLIFAGLGRDALWEDEGDTAVLASSILKFGVPTAWDGVTFSDADYGERLNRQLVMVSHPWVQYYAVAASFAVFGESAFAARLPFALAGLGTIVLVYLLAWRATGHRRVALSAALLLMLSVQFLVYARESRNYSLHAFLTCLLVWQFFRLRSWGSALAFALAGALLFHTHPMGLAAILALGLLTLGYAPFSRFRPWCLRAIAMMALATLPWFVFASRGYSRNTAVLREAAQFLPRLIQFGVECLSVTPIVGIAGLCGYAFLRRRALRAQALPVRDLVTVLAGIGAAYGIAIGFTQSRETIWMVGLRHTPAVLPFAMLLAAMAIVRVTRTRRAWLALLVVFSVTKFARVTPWVFWEEPTAFRRAAQWATFHLPPTVGDRLLRTALVGHVSSLLQANPGTTARISEFLNAHARSGDIVITNYAWEPLYFHTRLPQGMKVLPDYPIYPAAKALGLPQYVFDGGRPRWIVWRPAWGTAWGQDCQKIIATLRAAGVPVIEVATVAETLWENRENIHFRRFPGNQYIYPWYEHVPDATVYRVDWPGSTPWPSAGLRRMGAN